MPRPICVRVSPFCANTGLVVGDRSPIVIVLELVPVDGLRCREDLRRLAHLSGVGAVQTTQYTHPGMNTNQAGPEGRRPSGSTLLGLDALNFLRQTSSYFGDRT